MEADIVKADRTYRDLVYLLYAGVVLSVIVFVTFALPHIRAHFYTLGVMDMLVTLRTVFIVFMLSFIPAALYLIHIGMRILRHGCYPYPGRRVMFDTRVLRGSGARRRGRALVALGAVFLVLMLFSVVLTYVRMGSWIHNEEFHRFYGPPRRSAIV